MIDLTVKTLDSRNHAFSMPDDATVQQLKVKIEESMNIPANRQRLIFHGRVMQDDKLLSEYDVHGMVIHLVKSQPPQPGSRNGGSSSSGGSNTTNASDGPSRHSGPRYFGRVDGSTMFGPVVIPVLGESSGRHGAWRLMSTADRMIQRAVEVLDNHENSTSRSASAAPSATTTPYNSSRDSSGSHSPTADPSQSGRAASESRTNAPPAAAAAQSSSSLSAEGVESEMETDNNTATPHITVSNADQTASSGSSGTASSQEGASQDSSQPRQQRGPPSSTNMAALLTKLRALQNRFNPLLTRYHNLISEDPPTNNAQQLTERLVLTQTVPEVLHLLSHAYHAISELTIDWELAPPRQMRPLLAPAIQQLVQLTEGMNPWGVNIPPAGFGQQGQAATSTANAAGASGTQSASTSASASASASTGASASASATASSQPGSIPEMTYMTTTFPAEGGEATTTFTTRPAANFEAAAGTNSSTAGASTANRSPVVTASIDFSGRNTGISAAINAAYALANRIAAHQVGHASGQQPQQQPQQAQQQAQSQQQPQQPGQQGTQQGPQQGNQQNAQQGQARAGIVHLPVGMIDIPANVEFFMEVGPSTITIDSVEATVTNGAGSDGNPLNINFPWGSPPPQEFVHSVVQALNRIITPVTNPNMRRRGSAPESTQNPNLQRRGSAPESENAAAGSATTNASPATGNAQSASASTCASTSAAPGTGSASGQTSQARGYTATHPTTSTQTRSTARPHVHHHIAATQFPGYSVAYPIDPLLPCHSQFFAPWRRPRANGNNASNTANSSTQTSSNAAPQPSAAAASGRPRTSGLGPTAASTSASSSAPNTAQAQQGAPFMNFVQSFFGRDSPPGNDALTSVLGSLVAASSQGNQADVPIINWMFPGANEQEGESLLSDLRLAVVRSVTVSDLVALIESNWDAINHIRVDLHNFVIQRICQGSLTEENFALGVNRVLAELRPHFNIILEGAVKDDVDAVASLTRFHEIFIPVFFKLILDEELAPNFGRNLHEMIHKYLGRLWAIVKRCCANNEAVEAVFQSCLSRMSEEGSLSTWTARAYMGQLRLYTDGISVPMPEIEPYLVYRDTFSTSTPIQEAPAPVLLPVSPVSAPVPVAVPTTSQPSSSSGNVRAEEPVEKAQEALESSVSKGNIEPMDTDPQSPPQATTSAAALSLDIPSHSSEEAATARTSGDIGELDSPPLPTPAPEAWHRILPPEWVPIIARDATRQRRPNSQAPLSDAYLSGMPPKRRKVVTANKPQGSLSEVIAANMETAIQSSGVSTAGMTLVQEEAGSDPRLREAYREQLRATVRANLANNPDFSAERFPNAAQYFGKS